MAYLCGFMTIIGIALVQYLFRLGRRVRSEGMMEDIERLFGIRKEEDDVS